MVLIRRPPSRLIVFVAMAAVLIAGLLFALRPLFEARPAKVSLPVGAKRALPVSAPEPYVDVDAAGASVVALERDARHRLMVVARRVGTAHLRVYADARLLQAFDIEVTPAKLRKIDITPKFLKELLKPPELVAKKDPPPPPRPTLRELPKVEPSRALAKLPEHEPEPERERNIILPRKDEPRPPDPKKLEEKKKKELEKKLAEKKAPPPKEEEKFPLGQKPPQVQPPPGKKSVELDKANKKKPKEAKYFAQEDSAVEKETRAEKTTLIKTKPGDQQPDTPRGKDTPGDEKPMVADDRETAPNEAKERKKGRDKREFVAGIAEPPKQEKVQRESPVPTAPRKAPEDSPRSPGEVADHGRDVIADDMPSGPPRKVRIYPSAKTIAQVLREFPAPRKTQAEQAAEDGEDGTGAPNKGSPTTATRMPGGKWRKIWQRVNGFLENFLPEVSPGTHTALNAQKNAFAAYIAAAHRRIHVEWGFGLWSRFRGLTDSTGYNPIQSSIIARLEIKINRRGGIVRIGIVRTSGHTPFDGATMAAVLSAAPFGKPPEEMLSRDGLAYLHWNFYQDGRQCWTNDVQVFVND